MSFLDKSTRYAVPRLFDVKYDRCPALIAFLMPFSFFAPFIGFLSFIVSTTNEPASTYNVSRHSLVKV